MSLPDDIWTEISHILSNDNDLKTLSHLSQVNRYFRELILPKLQIHQVYDSYFFFGTLRRRERKTIAYRSIPGYPLVIRDFLLSAERLIWRYEDVDDIEHTQCTCGCG